MAMTKREVAEMVALREQCAQLLALRWTDCDVMPDIPALTRDYDPSPPYARIPDNIGWVEGPYCATKKTTSRGAVHSTKLRALRAHSRRIETKSAETLARIDAEIAAEIAAEGATNV